MSNLPWWVLMALGALFVLFVWPLLNGILFSAVGAVTGGGEKKKGA